jgi:hypothetical protein
MGFSANKSKNSSTQQSQSVSQSGNQAYNYLQSAYAPAVTQGTTASNAIANLLGLNGQQGQDAGFQTFKDSSGYNFMQDEGVRGIEAGNASKGLLGSGSALKAITGYSSNLAKSFLDSYLSNLGGLANNGLQAGNIIGGAGNVSNSNSNSSGQSKGSSFGLSLTGPKG